MNIYKAASITVLLIAVIALTAGLSSPVDQNTVRRATSPIFKGRDLPVVDFDAPEPTDPLIRASLRQKAKLYDNQSSQRIQEAPVSGRLWSNHWAKGLSALPVSISDVVLIGNITNAVAHLSNDKTGVYSQFDLDVQEVLKGENQLSHTKNVSVQRFGGAVRFASGRIQKYETSGQGMPVIGRTYLLFLKRIGAGPDYSIITGYDVSGPVIEPLDGAVADEGKDEYPFDKYMGMDLMEFLKEVRSVSQTASANP